MSKKISRELVLKVPKGIRKLAQKFRRQRLKKEQAEILEKRNKDAEKERVRVTRITLGLRHATKVYLWAKALKESSAGQELIKKHQSTYVIFFDGQIVGVPWVGLGISLKGLLLTDGGRFHYTRRMSSPEELAECVHTVTLQLASEWIDTGEVWDCIKRRFDYLKKK